MITRTLTEIELGNILGYGLTEEIIQRYIDYVVTRYGHGSAARLLMHGCENILKGQATENDLDIIPELAKLNP